jgi:hypothetical protein
MDSYPSSRSLVISTPDNPPLSLSERSQHVVACESLPDTIAGPGRLLGSLYSVVGHAIENRTNSAAHILGWGPDAVTDRIQKAFGHVAKRESMLDALYCSLNGMPGRSKGDLRTIDKDCLKLMQYALP